jgi:hypothetical protein
MSALFASGQIINLILALTLAEALIVAVYHRRTGRGPMLGPFLANLLAGVWLLLAVRCALAGAWWGWVAFCLLGSLVAHLAALRRSWV